MRIFINFFKKISKSLEVVSLFVFSVFSLIKNIRLGRKLIFNITMKQILFTGVDGLPVIGVASILIGAVIVLITSSIGVSSSVVIGFDIKTYVLILTIIKELGPLLTAIIIIGRSGTAISTELGNMKVRHEIEALETMGIDILHFIAAPRIIGMTISLVGLSLYFSFLGVVSGGLVSELYSSSGWIEFIRDFRENLQLLDVLNNIIKSLGFGCIISSISCYYGFQVQMSITEVPRATTKAVVRSIVWCFVYFAFIDILTYI